MGEVMALELVLFRSFFCFSTYTISYAVRANDFLCGKFKFYYYDWGSLQGS